MLMRSPWVRRLGSAGRALLVVRVRDAVNVAIGVGVVTRTSTHRPHTHTLTQAQARLFSATTATGVPPPPPEPRAWERQAYALHAVTARRSVPLAVPKPTYALDGRSVPLPSRVTLYSEEEILCAKKANVLASVMRKYAGTLVKVCPAVSVSVSCLSVCLSCVSLCRYRDVCSVCRCVVMRVPHAPSSSAAELFSPALALVAGRRTCIDDW